MQKHLILMACSATKASTAAPAIDLYQGVMYSTFHANAPATRPAVVILSAKHGFIEADRVIDPYEQRMTEARADEMLAELSDFDAIKWPTGVRSIFLAGGKAYRRVMRAAIERRIELGLLDRDVKIDETNAAGIGYQRAQLGAYLRAMARSDHPAHLFVDAAVKRVAFAPARQYGKSLAYEALQHAIDLGTEPSRIADVAHAYIDNAYRDNHA
jgi:hypothetical protein